MTYYPIIMRTTDMHLIYIHDCQFLYLPDQSFIKQQNLMML